MMKPLRIWMIVALVVMGAGPPARASDCSKTSTGFVPLTDLGADTYLGMQGGLYPGGLNTMPASHASAAPAIAPVNGKIGFAALGMSNTRQQFSAFLDKVGQDPAINPEVVFVNAAKPGRSAKRWSNPGDDAWDFAVSEVQAAGLTVDQVVVIWMKMGSRLAELPGNFPESADMEAQMIRDVVAIAATTFPNLKRVYLSGRIYGGYSTNNNHAEPRTGYENSFAQKWVVEDSVNGVIPTWVAWASYEWADGLGADNRVGGIPGRSDGLEWLCGDFESDGIHPARPAEDKTSQMLLDVFKTDPTTTPWFVVGGGGNQPPIADIVAKPTTGETPLVVDFDGTGSADLDGSIDSYHWDFGDGFSDTVVFTSHIYDVAGDYQAVLTVTDNEGATDTATVVINVTSPGANRPPVASFIASPSSGDAPLAVSFDASSSSDPDDGIVSYEWDFGDGGGSIESDVISQHTYSLAGSYTATLTVTDGQAAADSAELTINVTSPGANTPPDAVDDAIATPQDARILFEPLANDTDADGDTLTITAATQGANGSVAFRRKRVRYAPAVGFNGVDTFTYTISDGNGGGDTATVTVTVGE